jgi:adenine-specific DNA-methyltransferase
MAPRGKKSNTPKPTKSYRHTQAESPLRPDVGTQAQFRKKKPPRTYRYDSSLSPELSWDGQNATRELGEWLLARIQEAAALPAPHVFPHPQDFKGQDGTVLATVRGLKDATDQLTGLGAPFLNWAGKAERLSFDVPTLPLFVHERLSTKGIIETLKGHKKDLGEQLSMFELFGDPQHSIADQVLRAYEYRDQWVNRMILGDSLVVMNSLLAYEGLGGQVQMIYIDPPYGVKFGSNFQPFVRKREVKHNDDEDMTREPEMVKAYRDTWELGLHSYLTYMRDRLLLARELLAPSGSIFVQISDENVHHIRELMDEVYGAENFCGLIAFRKTAGASSPLAYVNVVASVADYLLWYARDRERVKYRQLYISKEVGGEGSGQYTWVEYQGEHPRSMTDEEKANPQSALGGGGRLLRPDNLASTGYSEKLSQPFDFEDQRYLPPANAHWKTTPEGLKLLAIRGRLIPIGKRLYYKRYIDDFSVFPMTNLWLDTGSSGFADPKLYVVQTHTRAVERCLLMTTDPGDLVLDPTCGSGTTAYVAEDWGRRWITMDCSRVPLALARQRVLTATFPWYELKDEALGPAGGFAYKRKQNAKGEEIGGIVPHVTLKSIANNEPPEEEVLVDRPEETKSITRVSGPFCVEATIPTPVDWDGDGVEDSGVAETVASYGSFVDRMIEVLRKSPVLHVGGGRTVTLKNVRQPAKTLSLCAEASVEGNEQPVAFVFGPENGAVSEKLVYEAAREAHAKNYSHLYVIGFAIQPNARKLVDDSEAAVGVIATYVQATPDLMMGDLLKNMRSSQIFSVCGLPEVKPRKVKPKDKDDPVRYEVELLGLDVFDPSTMETEHRAGNDVPAWFLDTDYNDLSFHVGQAFFPRTGAWDNLKKALKGLYEESVWDHLAGTTSAPFEAGEHGQIAVKVIDDRGNELLVVKKLTEVTP